MNDHSMVYERPVRRAIDAVVRRARELGDERQQATRVFADLQAGRRRLDDLSSAEAALLRGVPVIDRLLEQSRAVRFRDPAEMVRLADLARLAVERLERSEPGRHGPAVLADLQARTWGELGNAHRVAGDFAAAESALAQAASWARRGTGDLLLTARLGDLCASLCTDQGLFSEAARILHLVQSAYRSIGDPHLAGRALISKGLAVGHAGQPGPAVLAICDGLALIDPAREPELRLLGLHNLVYNLVEAGEHRRARMVLWQIRPLYQASGDTLNLLRLRWLEGKIYFGLGEDATAEGHFQAVRTSFAARGQLFDAMLVGLDLAMLWARQGRRDDVRKLAAGLAESFRALRIARETLASLIMLREWCGCPWVPDGILQDQIRIITALVNELDPEHPEQAATRSHRRKPRRFLHRRR